MYGSLKIKTDSSSNVFFSIVRSIYLLHQCSVASVARVRSSHPEVFLGKGVPKICSKFKGEHPCRSTISIKLQSNFIEIALRHGCSPVNLLHIFRISFLKNTPEWMLL